MRIDYILDRLRENGNRLAVVSDDTEYTFGDIYKKYEEVTEQLDDSHISFGNIVSVIAEFTPVSIAVLIALIERDAIIVPISKTVKGKENYIRISESQYVIDLQDDIQIKSTDVVPKHEMLLGIIRKKVPGLILFSSGTTGEPKAALHDLTYLMEKFRSPGKCLRTVTFLLFDHIGGFNTIMHSLSSGCMIATLKTRSPEEVCRIIEKYNIELLPTSPTFINMILLSRVYEKYDLSGLKMISYGTEPMPESTLKQLHRILPTVRLKQTYGLSEVGIMSTKSEASDSLWMKIGGDGYETKIKDGILYIRAKSAMVGYLNAPSPFDGDGWFNTKDKVEKKGDYIKILGRTTDLINVGGEKVYPNEIESVLLSFEGVRDVYVYGEPNPITGQSVTADVCVEEKFNNREYIKRLRRYCKENLEPYKRPVSYKLTAEMFYGDRFKKKR